MFMWLKRFMPRGLYGRVVAIFLLPVLSIQGIVAAAFIQRYFEDVTEQMTRAMLPVIELVIGAGEGATDLAQELGITWEPGSGAIETQFAFFDLPARVIARELEAQGAWVTGVDLSQSGTVIVGVDAPSGRLVIPRWRMSAANPHQLLVVMAVLGAVMTYIAYLYLRNQLRPIQRLGRAAEAYGRGRVVPYRLAGATEVRAAGAAFLDMRARLERQSQSRRLMLSGISHDLRTPLTRMRLDLSLMEDQEAAAPLLSDVADMEHMVGVFLDYSRETDTDLPQPTDPAALLRDAVEAANRGRAAQIVTMTELADVPLATFRPVAVRRALDNLLANGVRHGDHVRASMSATPKELRFVIEDNGPGIPDAQRADAIRAFTRLDPARGQQGGASVGLGLAIVTDIARTHGGRLDLSDSALGGLCATLVIPR